MDDVKYVKIIFSNDHGEEEEYNFTAEEFAGWIKDTAKDLLDKGEQ